MRIKGLRNHQRKRRVNQIKARVNEMRFTVKKAPSREEGFKA
jgi:hypothetical protein